MNKIDLIIDALEGMCGDRCNTEYNLCQASVALAAAHELKVELAKPEQESTACGYDETVGMCTNNPCCEQMSVAHLWECIGRWSAYLVVNGKQGNLAPPTWLVDAVKAATTPPRKPEQEQEPVKCTCGYAIGHPLVTSCSCKPRKPWVGLTDKEMELLVIQAREVPIEIPCDSFTTRLLKLAEAKLKEKNTTNQ